AFGIEVGRRAVAGAGRNRRALAVIRAVEIDHMIAVFRCLGVRDPMAVGRPSVIVYVVVKPLVNEDWLFLLNVNIKETRLFVGKHELLAVGGPDRRQAKHLAVRRDPDFLSKTVLRR